MTAQLAQRPPVHTQAVSDTRPGKYLTFRLGREQFGIQVLRVREILGIQDITHAPGMPPHLKGVINLRGKSSRCLPASQIRFPGCAVYPNHLHHRRSGGARWRQSVIGLLVDSVCEVLTFLAADSEDAPDFGEAVETPFVLGIAQYRGTVKILLRIQDVLPVQELCGIADLVQQAGHFPAEAAR
jgi:purine-binding chemotaxis protein CheW